MTRECLLCNWAAADRQFQRLQVWQDDLWRLTTSLATPVAGFSYLEPKRHVPYIVDLDGAEADTLGRTLAAVTASLRRVTGATLVYVNVFGDHQPHLHFNLAPRRAGDALTGGPGMLAPTAEPLPRAALRQVADGVATDLAAGR